MSRQTLYLSLLIYVLGSISAQTTPTYLDLSLYETLNLTKAGQYFIRTTVISGDKTEFKLESLSNYITFTYAEFGNIPSQSEELSASYYVPTYTKERSSIKYVVKGSIEVSQDVSYIVLRIDVPQGEKYVTVTATSQAANIAAGVILAIILIPFLIILCVVIIICRCCCGCCGGQRVYSNQTAYTQPTSGYTPPQQAPLYPPSNQPPMYVPASSGY